MLLHLEWVFIFYLGCIGEAGGKCYSYRMSKAGVNIAFRSIAQDLKE